MIKKCHTLFDKIELSPKYRQYIKTKVDRVEFRQFFFYLFVVIKSHTTSSQNRCPPASPELAMAGRRRVPCIISYAGVSSDETFLKTIRIETGFRNWCAISIFTLLNFPEGTLFNRVNTVWAGIVKDLKSLDRHAYTSHSIIMGKRKNSWQDTDSEPGPDCNGDRQAPLSVGRSIDVKN